MLKVGIVGCGDIMPAYLEGLRRFPRLVEVVWCSDVVAPLAASTAATYGIPRWGSVEQNLADDGVDAIVNLTPPKVHAEVIDAATSAGKHVFTEKPLAVSVETAKAVTARAAHRGLLVGAAPDTFLGQAGQTARWAIDRGDIGDPIGCVAFAPYRRIERRHPDPRAYFGPGGGPALDVGPYVVASLVNLLGPIEAVSGISRIGGSPRRVVRDTDEILEIPVSVDTHATALLRFAAGAAGTLVLSYDIWDHELPAIEVYGTEGTLAVPLPIFYEGDVRIRLHDDADWRVLSPVVPSVLEHPREKIRGLGVIDLAQTVEGGFQRTTAGLALHTLEVLAAIEVSSREARVVEIRTSCRTPLPLTNEDYRAWGLA